MNLLQPKLHLRLSQKQILTPSLVQMVNLLVLNRLELRGMIDQELMTNPVLEEIGEDGITTENYADEAFEKAELEKLPETEAANPFEDFDLSSFYTEYLDGNRKRRNAGNRKSMNGPRLRSSFLRQRDWLNT